jgi:hypothetical protein
MNTSCLHLQSFYAIGHSSNLAVKSVFDCDLISIQQYVIEGARGGIVVKAQKETFLGSKVRPLRRTYNLTDIREPTA